MKCPYCKKSDQTEPFLRITEKIVEWICYRCGVTFNVEE